MGNDQWSFCTIGVLLRERSIAMDLEGFQSNPPVHLVGLRESTLLIGSWWPSGHQNWHKDLQWLTSEWDFPIINGPTFAMGPANRYKVCPYWMFADIRGIQSQVYYQKLMRFFYLIYFSICLLANFGPFSREHNILYKLWPKVQYVTHNGVMSHSHSLNFRGVFNIIWGTSRRLENK